jgi:hypothetical protein
MKNEVDARIDNLERKLSQVSIKLDRLSNCIEVFSATIDLVEKIFIAQGLTEETRH